MRLIGVAKIETVEVFRDLNGRQLRGKRSLKLIE